MLSNAKSLEENKTNSYSRMLMLKKTVPKRQRRKYLCLMFEEIYRFRRNLIHRGEEADVMIKTRPRN